MVWPFKSTNSIHPFNFYLSHAPDTIGFAVVSTRRSTQWGTLSSVLQRRLRGSVAAPGVRRGPLTWRCWSLSFWALTCLTVNNSGLTAVSMMRSKARQTDENAASTPLTPRTYSHGGVGTARPTWSCLPFFSINSALHLGWWQGSAFVMGRQALRDVWRAVLPVTLGEKGSRQSLRRG